MKTISDEEYQFLRGLIYDYSCIDLNADQKPLLTRCVATRMQSHDITSLKDYLKLLKDSNLSDEVDRLVDAVTINHTYFFREPEHFLFLENLISEGQPPFNKKAAPRIWSSACATGEEAYSIAMTLEACCTNQNWKVACSDISKSSLAQAASGIFHKGATKHISLELTKKYFQKGKNIWEESIKAKETLRKNMHFYPINLASSSYPLSDSFDIIFCRNVMIYFDRATQEKVVNQLSSMLNPSGYLIIGSSENLFFIKHNLESIHPSIFQLK